MFEIERRFLINNQNEIKYLTDIKMYTINQYYISFDKSVSKRIRKITFEDGSVQYYHTTKIGKGLVRLEHEVEITEREYNKYVPKEAIPIEKIRLEANDGYGKFCIDSIIMLNLRIIEKEFDSEKEALTFTPPAWCGKEITNDPNYSAETIWNKIQKNGRRCSIYL